MAKHIAAVWSLIILMLTRRDRDVQWQSNCE